MDLIQLITAMGCFHDGTMLSVQRVSDSLVLKVEIQYLAEMIDPEYEFFTCQFMNCEDFYFESWVGSKRITDTSDIAVIGLEISNAAQADDYINIVCLSSDPNVIGGNLFIKAEDLIIRDEGSTLVTLDEITKLTDEYWSGSC